MSERIATLTLRQGRAKPLHAGHPWVFADAIAQHDGPRLESGDEVRIADHRGRILGRGYFSKGSAIAVRLLTRQDEPADRALLARRIDDALRLRHEVLTLGGEKSTAYRLIHSEGDGLPGLIVDRYDAHLAVQIGTAGMDRRREILLDLLAERLQPLSIADKSDARVRKLEGLPPPSPAALRGRLPDGPFEVRECSISIRCDLRPDRGQKTGLYLDQRENRCRFAQFAQGRRVLDAFAYTGAFSLHAAQAGAASLTLLDASEPALEDAKANLECNGIADADLVCAKWSDGLRHLAEAGRAFDLVVLDPPKFARGKDAVATALNGYRDLNALAAPLLAPGGLLFTCSCSGNVSAAEFERAVATGLASSGREAVLLETRGAAPDHPIPPGFDQGRYLKGLLLALR